LKTGTFSKSSCTRLLPIELWPDADRKAWLAAEKSGSSHVPSAYASRKDLLRYYGYFLDFVLSREGFDSSLPAAGHVTPDRVEAYSRRLDLMVSPLHAHRTCNRLRLAAQLLAPQHDWKWLMHK
jgi:hypothetical protein